MKRKIGKSVRKGMQMGEMQLEDAVVDELRASINLKSLLA